MGEGLRTLVVGPAWVGDMVMAQALYKRLRQAEPEGVIDVLAPAWSLPLLARMPEVRRGIEVPLGHGQFGLAARYRLGRQLRGERYDRAIVLPRSFKAALIPFFAGVKLRTGYRGEMRYGLVNDMRPLDKSVLTRTVDRYLALGLGRGEPLPPTTAPSPQLHVDSSNRERLLEAHGLEAGAIALLPGAAYGPAKQWPLAHWAALLCRLRAQGEQVWLLGSRQEAALAQQIIDASDCREGVVNLCGKDDLVAAVDLLSACRAAVSNDSGLMHVAAAVGIPLVGIYGSSTPDYTPPLSPHAVALTLRLECSPCFKRECPYGHYHCLTGIAPEQVSEALSQLLNSGGAA